jgi:hypothetical protein
MFKGFGWFTKEALEKNKEIWIDNIVGVAKGAPHNPIELQVRKQLLKDSRF